MHTRLALRTQLKISPQFVLAGKLLEAPGIDIEQLVYRELTSNPALELASEQEPPAHRRSATSSQSGALSGRSRIGPVGSGAAGASLGSENSLENIAMRLSAVDQLVAQARLMVDRHDLDVAVFLLYSLDNHGYLRTPPGELAAELGVATASVERVIRVLHQLEPPGIGARDLRECLLIQCAHLESERADCRVARRMLAEAWDDFINQRWQRISRQLGVSGREIKRARRFMYRHLYPYPLPLLEDSLASNDLLYNADLIIRRETSGGGFNYSLEAPGAGEFELGMSTGFENALQANSEMGCSAEERAWMEACVERARLFIAALNHRWATLRRIGEYLIDYQQGFLERGPLYLKPLSRAAVARELDLHESTVGRAIRDKVVQLPDGRLIPMRDFFDDSLAAKEAIRQLLARTNEPLSDREIASRLQAEGLNLARRTVSKYRRQLNIPARHRRQRGGALSLAR